MTNPLTLSVIDSILEKLYKDQESKPALASAYTEAINHYHAEKRKLLGIK